VDDLISGCDNFEEGKIFVQRAREILSKAGLELRKWVTNDPKLRIFIESCKTVSCTNSGSENRKQVLGLDWDTVSDEFLFGFDKFVKKCDGIFLTKRNILSVAASFYDTLGFISPITARVKVLFSFSVRIVSAGMMRFVKI